MEHFTVLNLGVAVVAEFLLAACITSGAKNERFCFLHSGWVYAGVLLGYSANRVLLDTLPLTGKRAEKRCNLITSN